MSCHYKTLPPYPGNALRPLPLKSPLIAAFTVRHDIISFIIGIHQSI